MHNKTYDFRDYKKRQLSASSSGRGIKVSATSSAGTLIHTALASEAVNEWDEVSLYATNTSGSAVELTVEWGGTTNPDDRIILSIPSKTGLTLVIPGLVVQNGVEVRAFADTADVIVIHGYVNRFKLVGN